MTTTTTHIDNPIDFARQVTLSTLTQALLVLERERIALPPFHVDQQTLRMEADMLRDMIDRRTR